MHIYSDRTVVYHRIFYFSKHLVKTACGAGGQTLEQVWENFSRTCAEDVNWLQSNKFLEATGLPNIETLSDQLDIAKLDLKRTGDSAKLLKLSEVQQNIRRAIYKAAILQDDFWKNPSSLDTSTSPLKSHRTLIQKLCGSRQPSQNPPWIFSLNYDLAIEWAAESLGLQVINGFSGLHCRTFSPHNFDLGFRNLLAKGEARFGTYNIFLAKLHGSLSWRTQENNLITEESCRSIWNSLEPFIQGQEWDENDLLVFPGVSKYFQTNGYVLGEMFRRFSEYLSRPQACVVLSGYSFSDLHLNRVLKTALQNPTLQMVIYLPEVEEIEGKISLGKVNLSAKQLIELDLPQITVVGGGKDAHFDSVSRHLPEPVFVDQQSDKIKALLRTLEKGMGKENSKEMNAQDSRSI